jgi:hypothetical protein
MLISIPLSAQDQSQQPLVFEFRGETMVEALNQIVLETDIDLVYDPELVRNIYVYQRMQHQSIPALLGDLLSKYRLDYITLSSGTIIIVRSTHETPAYGTISGKIVDMETGEPLPGASVMLADASGGTSTNRTGYFSINRVISGTHHLIISYLGYESAYKTINVSPNQQVQERIDLTPKRFDVTPLVVEAHRTLLPSNSSSLVLNADSEISPSGMMASPIRNLNLVSGVQYGLPVQDLHLQGSHQGEHRILLDGIPIYNPYSFGQLFSSFSPFAIGNVKLHKAGYGVQEGSQMAGLVELSNDLSYSGNNSALFQADPLSVNLRGDLSIPLKNNNAIETMAAVRTSYWNIYQNPSLNQMLRDWDVIDPLIADRLLNRDENLTTYEPFTHESDVNFFDFHVTAGYQPDAFSNLSASLYLAENAIETRVLNQTSFENDSPRFLYASDGHEWSNVAGMLEWNKMVSPRLDLSFQTAYSENRFVHQNSLGLSEVSPFRTVSAWQSDAEYLFSPGASFPLPTQIDGNHIRHFLIRSDASYSISPTFSVDGGLQTDRVLSRVDISDTAFLGTNTSQQSTILSSYLNGNHTFNRNWRLTFGSRLTYLSSAENIYAEPRFSIQYDRPESQIGYWSFRIAGGLYRQFINEFRVSNTGATSIVPDITIWSHADNSEIPKAYHLTGSLLIEPVERTTISIEGFYKWQPVSNITSYQNLITGDELDRNEVRAFAGTTEMTILGAGFRIHHQFGNSNVRMVAGYDYSYNQMDLSEQFGRKMMSPWNEPHRTQLRTIWRLTSNFSALAKWQGIWGRTWAFRQSYYNFLRTTDSESPAGTLFNNPDKDTLSTFQQVDLSFIYQPRLRTTDMELRLELINLLNRRNSIEKYLMPVLDNGQVVEYEVMNRQLPGFYPSVSLQVKF